jgi:hypothetical protein
MILYKSLSTCIFGIYVYNESLHAHLVFRCTTSLYMHICVSTGRTRLYTYIWYLHVQWFSACTCGMYMYNESLHAHSCIHLLKESVRAHLVCTRTSLYTHIWYLHVRVSTCTFVYLHVERLCTRTFGIYTYNESLHAHLVFTCTMSLYMHIWYINVQWVSAFIFRLVNYGSSYVRPMLQKNCNFNINRMIYTNYVTCRSLTIFLHNKPTDRMCPVWSQERGLLSWN